MALSLCIKENNLGRKASFMKHLIQQFKAHPIGQGLFYSGRVNITGLDPADSSFNFVFDCGSINTTNANEEVELYRSRHLQENNAILDLLVISHFDVDHVSHIKKLLDKRKVKKVVLPFATFEERLFLVLKYYNNIIGRTRLSDDFPITFMLDPIGSLGDYLNGNSTIYIVNSDPDKPFDGPGEENTNEPSASGNDENGLTFDVNAAEIDSTVEAQFFITGIDGGKVKMYSDAEKC